MTRQPCSPGPAPGLLLRRVVQFGWMVGAICAAAPAVSGCADEAGECAADSADPIAAEDAWIWPRTVHMGANGRDEFLAVVTGNFSVERWEIADEGVVGVAPLARCSEPGLYELAAVLTAKAPGTTTVTAVSGSIRLPVEVMVAEYTTAQTDLGRQRYTMPAPPEGPDRIPCTVCHEPVELVGYAPPGLAAHRDEDIAAAIQTGRYPAICADGAGRACQCGTAGCIEIAPGRVLGGMHTWNLFGGEVEGIVAYLRSLRPPGMDPE